MQKYNLEFILYVYSGTLQTIKSALSEFGENLEVIDYKDEQGAAKSLKIKMKTDDPTAVFDICAEFGRIKSVKVNEA
ncbi:MAG: hypothetical protein KJ793_04315, partial [Candidatus Omnitrophica bacterium]|nr:hypothetical protein [Candidatus Omnitrophota bacterium]